MFGQRQVPSITAPAVHEGAYLLDVREDDEWAAGRAPDAAHIPMSELPGRLDEVPMDRQVVVACRVGARSAQVAAWLNVNGYDAVNLEGGMVAWQAAGRPIVGDSADAFVL
jgi:rhodanese-related sulfurtransferase